MKLDILHYFRQFFFPLPALYKTLSSPVSSTPHYVGCTTHIAHQNSRFTGCSLDQFCFNRPTVISLSLFLPFLSTAAIFKVTVHEVANCLPSSPPAAWLLLSILVMQELTCIFTSSLSSLFKFRAICFLWFPHSF